VDDELMKRASDALALEKQLCLGVGAIEEASRIIRETTATATLSRAIEEASQAARESMAMSALQRFEEDSGIRQLLKTIDQRKELQRIALGSVIDLQGTRSLFPDLVSPLQREMERLRESMAALEAPRFLLPEISQAARLIAEIRINHPSEILTKYFESESKLQQAIDSMRTPWLDAQEAIRSITSFAELQGIGHALSTMSAFDEVLVSGLRMGLGDWRDRITWPSEIFTDLTIRSDFYADLGFNRALIDFPIPAFEQSLRIAGLRQEPPPWVDPYRAPIPHTVDSDEEESLARTNMAHDLLMRFETQLRRLIDERMSRSFGSDWPKHRLPKDMYDKWQEKKNAQLARHGELPLIAYADFTDYPLVICKRDNWNQVFAPLYQRPESVRESFQRLHLVRIDTMHARMIMQEDELLLYVETQRLLKVFR
jgi:hypothetical protein